MSRKEKQGGGGGVQARENTNLDQIRVLEIRSDAWRCALQVVNSQEDVG